MPIISDVRILQQKDIRLWSRFALFVWKASSRQEGLSVCQSLLSIPFRKTLLSTITVRGNRTTIYTWSIYDKMVCSPICTISGILISCFPRVIYRKLHPIGKSLTSLYLAWLSILRNRTSLPPVPTLLPRSLFEALVSSYLTRKSWGHKIVSIPSV